MKKIILQTSISELRKLAESMEKEEINIIKKMPFRTMVIPDTPYIWDIDLKENEDNIFHLDPD